jgi:hypothetical protein
VCTGLYLCICMCAHHGAYSTTVCVLLFSSVCASLSCAFMSLAQGETASVSLLMRSLLLLGAVSAPFEFMGCSHLSAAAQSELLIWTRHLLTWGAAGTVSLRLGTLDCSQPWGYTFSLPSARPSLWVTLQTHLGFIKGHASSQGSGETTSGQAGRRKGPLEQRSQSRVREEAIYSKCPKT